MNGFDLMNYCGRLCAVGRWGRGKGGMKLPTAIEMAAHTINLSTCNYWHRTWPLVTDVFFFLLLNKKNKLKKKSEQKKELLKEELVVS